MWFNLVKLKELSLPKTLKLEDVFKGFDITPLQRLEVMDPDKFEELTEVWLHSKIQNKYQNIKRNGGAGDKGRDIIGYYLKSKKIDIYQCKHYQNPLSFSDMSKEFLKLCYYTFKKDFSIPESYFIVSSKGCSTKFRTDYLDKPKNINKKLIDCMKKNEIKLEGKKLKDIIGFTKYIESFDFRIVKEIVPATLIEEFWGSKYRPYYFGGGLKPFVKPNVEIPSEIQEEERQYINQLLLVYSEKDGFKYITSKKIPEKYNKHFEWQRTYYYSIETFRRVVRDNLPSIDYFNEVEDAIFEGINDIVIDPFSDGYKKLTDSLKMSTLMNLDMCTLKSELSPNEKKGVCHRLTNKKRIRWVEDE